MQVKKKSAVSKFVDRKKRQNSVDCEMSSQVYLGVKEKATDDFVSSGSPGNSDMKKSICFSNMCIPCQIVSSDSTNVMNTQLITKPRTKPRTFFRSNFIEKQSAELCEDKHHIPLTSHVSMPLELCEDNNHIPLTSHVSMPLELCEDNHNIPFTSHVSMPLELCEDNNNIPLTSHVSMPLELCEDNHNIPLTSHVSMPLELCEDNNNIPLTSHVSMPLELCEDNHNIPLTSHASMLADSAILKLSNMKIGICTPRNDEVISNGRFVPKLSFLPASSHATNAKAENGNLVQCTLADDNDEIFSTEHSLVNGMSCLSHRLSADLIHNEELEASKKNLTEYFNNSHQNYQYIDEGKSKFLSMAGTSNEDDKIIHSAVSSSELNNCFCQYNNGLSPSVSHSAPHSDSGISSHELLTAYKSDGNCQPSASDIIGKVGKTEPIWTHLVQNEIDLCGSESSSFSSASTMPAITTKEARSRSYLDGNVRSVTMSILGREELERHFPDRKSHVFVGSWNMNEMKSVTVSLNDFILPESSEFVQDIYAIGSQENVLNKKEWDIHLQETLGPSHVLLHSKSFGALHLAVFLRRDLVWFCSADRSSSKIKFRLLDYHRVTRELRLPKSPSGRPRHRADVTATFDCVFWCGDLNFRLERHRSAVERKVMQVMEPESKMHFEELLVSDQLSKYVVQGEIFEGFQEGRITFQPTFKFDVNTDNYDSSHKMRIPSYTDRVLFRCRKKNDVVCLHYDAVLTIRSSDHRPVYAVFEVGLRPGKDNSVPMCGGKFKSEVFLEANRRRAQVPGGKGGKVSTICAIQ